MSKPETASCYAVITASVVETFVAVYIAALANRPKCIPKFDAAAIARGGDYGEGDVQGALQIQRPPGTTRQSAGWDSKS
jgi:hypothetical protein